ncbi:O-antigen polymerase [Calothrix sp. PCC 7507]|uniref:O-antigen polymerase n=1 Tax=Calothrix sp. PCC 7507 TaxID=99598 RepID=UPI00029F45A8|nr:O-antigen polymerase [Calothrix sp. PCC 7507]AFY32496.1 O-antigen polymerase [Calothrix sp. PCC 7507]
MRQQIFAPTPNNQDSHVLFQGIWLRWQALTHAERVVCMGIILIPIWWVIGWGVVLFLWVTTITIYEFSVYQRVRLSKPSIEVIAIALFAFNSAIAYILNSPEVVPRALLNPFLTWGCGGLLLWYIQSNQIRLRLQVVAWAFSLIICMMLIWWVFFHFVLSEPNFIPPRTLYAVIFDKGAYNPSKLGSVGNFLVPYMMSDNGFGGLRRYTFFLPHPTTTSFVIGFAGLIALDIKNRYWSLPIVAGCTFLMIICQARNSWVALPIVLIIRWLFIAGKTKGLTFILVLSTILSFTTLCVPTMTDWIIETRTNTVEATSNFRKDSTEIRNLIYQRTWENVIEEPSLIGHGINGTSVQPGYEFAALGTESFILGTLLYKSGFLGTGLFLTYFVFFLASLYKTRSNKPACCFLVLLYLGLTSPVTEFDAPVIFIPLISTMLYQKQF